MAICYSLDAIDILDGLHFSWLHFNWFNQNGGDLSFFLVCFIVVDVPMKQNRKVVQLTIFTNQIERIVQLKKFDSWFLVLTNLRKVEWWKREIMMLVKEIFSNTKCLSLSMGINRNQRIHPLEPVIKYLSLIMELHKVSHTRIVASKEYLKIIHKWNCWFVLRKKKCGTFYIFQKLCTVLQDFVILSVLFIHRIHKTIKYYRIKSIPLKSGTKKIVQIIYFLEKNDVLKKW